MFTLFHGVGGVGLYGGLGCYPGMGFGPVGVSPFVAGCFPGGGIFGRGLCC